MHNQIKAKLEAGLIRAYIIATIWAFKLLLSIATKLNIIALLGIAFFGRFIVALLTN